MSTVSFHGQITLQYAYANSTAYRTAGGTNPVACARLNSAREPTRRPARMQTARLLHPRETNRSCAERTTGMSLECGRFKASHLLGGGKNAHQSSFGSATARSHVCMPLLPFSLLFSLLNCAECGGILCGGKFQNAVHSLVEALR